MTAPAQAPAARGGPPPPPPMVQLDRVRGRFGDFTLEVSLEVPRGAYTVILGPSGCGKSLLLGTVAGLYPPDGGRVLLDGQDLTAAPPERRGVGFVFQKSSLFPHLSVRHNVAFALAVRGRPRAEREARVDELCGALGLRPLLDRPVRALSGGEAQRVAVARALAWRPRVLLLDEPLSLVDHNARLQLQAELRQLQADLGLTTLHVTHSREEARALGQRCAVMLGGRIVQAGELSEIFEAPRCLFVARFLGLRQGPPPPGPGCDEACLAGTGRCTRPAGEGG